MKKIDINLNKVKEYINKNSKNHPNQVQNEDIKILQLDTIN